MPRRRDPLTLDLFAWTPPPVTRRFEAVQVRAAGLRGSLARAVATSLKECGRTREDVARDMTAYLGEDVPKTMLDAYASQAREDHTISALRLVALIHATRDIRLLNLIADLFGWAVVPQKYLPAIEEAVLADKIEELSRRKTRARQNWKAGQ
ncbi:MAG: hypothetical protein V6Z86_05955 [Hyphomicrobiales bacterium]